VTGAGAGTVVLTAGAEVLIVDAAFLVADAAAVVGAGVLPPPPHADRAASIISKAGTVISEIFRLLNLALNL